MASSITDLFPTEHHGYGAAHCSTAESCPLQNLMHEPLVKCVRQSKETVGGQKSVSRHRLIGTDLPILNAKPADDILARNIPTGCWSALIDQVDPPLLIAPCATLKFLRGRRVDPHDIVKQFDKPRIGRKALQRDYIPFTQGDGMTADDAFGWQSTDALYLCGSENGYKVPDPLRRLAGKRDKSGTVTNSFASTPEPIEKAHAILA